MINGGSELSILHYWRYLLLFNVCIFRITANCLLVFDLICTFDMCTN